MKPPEIYSPRTLARGRAFWQIKGLFPHCPFGKNEGITRPREVLHCTGSNSSFLGIENILVHLNWFPGGRNFLFLSQAEEQRSQKTRALLKSRALVLEN